MEYCWPGNVRELENSFEYAFVMTRGERIDVFDLPQEVRVAPLRKQLCGQDEQRPSSATIGGRTPIGREELRGLLEKNGWNKSATARELGISRVALWKKIKTMELEEPGTAAS